MTQVTSTEHPHHPQAMHTASAYFSCHSSAHIQLHGGCGPPAGVVVTAEELEEAVARVGEFGGDNRAGIDRTLHRISCIRNRVGRIVGLTCRVGRAVPGSAAMVADIIMQGRSLLLLGRPGSGKTTTLVRVPRWASLRTRRLDG